MARAFNLLFRNSSSIEIEVNLVRNTSDTHGFISKVKDETFNYNVCLFNYVVLLPLSNGRMKVKTHKIRNNDDSILESNFDHYPVRLISFCTRRTEVSELVCTE